MRTVRYIQFAAYSAEWRECDIPECPTFWSPWSEWTECSVTCGGGFQKKIRSCLDVSNGGKYCDGKEKEIRPCHKGQCQESQREKEKAFIHEGLYINKSPMSVFAREF